MSSPVLKYAKPSNQKSPTAELLLLAWPMIVMMTSRMMMQLIDTFIVGRLGDEQLAAIMPAMAFAFVIICLGMGVSTCVQTFVSQADGRETPKEAASFVWQSIYGSILYGLVTIPLALTTEYWYRPLAQYCGHSPTVIAHELAYLRVALWCVAPSTICVGLQAFLNGAKRPIIGLVAVIISLFVNAATSYVFAFGKLGFPAMGIGGAALGTVFGWAARALILMYSLWMPSLARRYGTNRIMPLDWLNIKKLLHIGIPSSIQWLIDIGSWTFFSMAVIPLFGSAAMAANNAAMQFMHLCFMPAIGLSMAVTSQVGNEIGRKDYAKANLRAFVCFKTTAVFMVTGGVLTFIFARPLIGLMTESQEVIQLGRFMLAWAMLFQFCDAMNMTYQSALRGAGDTRVPAVISAIFAWIFEVVGAYTIAKWWPELGVNGPWAMFTLYICLIGPAFLWRWKGGKWKNIKLFDDTRGLPATPTEAPVVLVEEMPAGHPDTIET